jgi:hypothetical protein
VAFLVPSANAASRVARAVLPYPWCPTPPRETRAADDNFAAGDAILRVDIAKLCPACLEHHVPGAVEAEPGVPEGVSCPFPSPWPRAGPRSP